MISSASIAHVESLTPTPKPQRGRQREDDAFSEHGRPEAACALGAAHFGGSSARSCAPEDVLAVTKSSAQFAGGAPPSARSNGAVRANRSILPIPAENFAMGSPQMRAPAAAGVPGHGESVDFGLSCRTNCDTLPAVEHRIGERGGNLARRRFQKGRVFLRGKNPVWVGRWREDEKIEDGRIRRVERSEVLGSKSDFPTKRLAFRELEKRLCVVNDPRYRARPTATFAEFASRWESLVLTQHKPSTQATIRSHLRKHLNPFFGRWQMREIGPEEVQRFVSSVKVSGKTAKNLFATIQMLWKSARAWDYVAHDAVSDVVLPKRHRVSRRFYSIEEIQRILAAATEPLYTFYWLAAEAGMRAGELCGLRVDDFDFERRLVAVRQSVWRGKFQSPKSENAVRCFALSPRLLAHIVDFLKRWKPNERRLLFATHNGTPWDANLLVKRKLCPLLDSLGIERGGLHAFRHANSTLMDRLGVPLKVRQERLGHSDPSLTLGVYTHVVSGDDARIAEQLDALLRGAANGEEKGQADAILRPIAPKPEKQGAARFEQPLVN
jgi:integrase